MFYKALIRSVMTYACRTWEYAADSHLLKLQCLQNRVLRAAENLDRCTPVSDLHVAFLAAASPFEVSVDPYPRVGDTFVAERL
jgi:hypothetical protein